MVSQSRGMRSLTKKEKKKKLRRLALQTQVLSIMEERKSNNKLLMSWLKRLRKSLRSPRDKQNKKNNINKTRKKTKKRRPTKTTSMITNSNLRTAKEKSL